MKHQTHWKYCVVLTACLHPISAWAQQSSPETLELASDERDGVFALSLESLLDQEVVSASLAPQSQEEAAAMVYVVQRSTIEQRGYTHLAQLLEDLPGVEVNRRASAENRDRITMRGITGNSKFLVLRDGFRVSSASGTAHHIGYGYSLANVDRVEVVLGPASALYGSDAFAGAVNLITRSGGQWRGAKATTSFGSFGTTESALTVGDQWGDVQLVASASVYTSEGPHLPNAYRDDFSWYHEQYAPTGTVRVSPFAPPEVTRQVPLTPYDNTVDAYSLNVRADFGNLMVQFDRIRAAHSTATSVRPEFSVASEEASTAYTLQTMMARHSLQPTDSLRLSTRIASQLYSLDPQSSFVNSFSQYERAYKYEENWVTRLQQTASYQPSENHSLTLGAGYRYVSSLAYTGDLPKPYQPGEASALQQLNYPGTEIEAGDGRDLAVPQDVFSVQRETYDVFGELFSRPADFVSLTLGARFDQDSQYGGTFAPRAGAVLHLAQNTSFKLLYGIAFLSPAIHTAYSHFGAFEPVDNEQGDVTGLRAGFFRLPNPDLEPEQVRTTEASLHWHGFDSLAVDANAYYSDFRNRITNEVTGEGTFKGWPVSAIERKVNGGEAQIYGGTLRLKSQLSFGDLHTEPFAAYTYTRGKLDQTSLPVTPRHWLRAGLDLRWRSVSTSARVLVRGRAKHETATDERGVPVRIPGSAVLNLFLQYRDVLTTESARASAFCRITNALDARYYHPSDENADVFAASPQAPRSVQLGLTVDWGR